MAIHPLLAESLIIRRTPRCVALTSIAVFLIAGTSGGQAPPPVRLELRTTIDGNKVEFGQIGAIVADREGRIFAADVHQTAQQIVVLSPDGNRLRAMGGRGGGPWEFTHLFPSLAWMGDTLVAMEKWGGEQRIVLFDRMGNPVATKTSARGSGHGNAVGFFTDGGGAFLLETRRVPYDIPSGNQPIPPFPHTEPRYLRVSRDGSTVHKSTLGDSVTTMGGGLGAPSFCRSEDQRALPVFRPPFSDRGPLRACTGGHLLKAHTDTYQIDFVDIASGRLVRSVRRSIPRVPLRDEDWNALPEIHEVREAEKEIRGGRPFELHGSPGTPCPIYGMRPEFLPVLRTIVTDESGRLWVEVTSRQGFTLDLFDASGRFLGGTPMPDRDPRVGPYVRGNLLYVVTVDDVGVQGMKVYELKTGP